MDLFIADWNVAAEFWGDRMWAVLWQSTFFAAVVALACVLFLRRTSPAVRYWVWQIVAIKLLVMPFWTYAIARSTAIPAQPDPVQSTAVVAAREQAGVPQSIAAVATVPAHEAPDSPADVSTIEAEKPASDVRNAALARSLPGRISWLGWLLCAWGIVVVTQFVRILWQHRRLARLLRETTPADATLTALVREAAGRVGLQRVPYAVLTDVECSPFVCGICQAVLVLPRGLTATLSATELNHVLLHELAHVRRLDLVWGWIAELARIVYFFHPVMHWIAYRVRLERELACDQLAMATSGQGAAEYAATLVRVVSQASEPSVFKTSAASAGLNGETP